MKYPARAPDRANPRAVPETVEEDSDFCEARESQQETGTEVVDDAMEDQQNPVVSPTAQRIQIETQQQGGVTPQKEDMGDGDDLAVQWCAGHVCLRLRPDGLREEVPKEHDKNYEGGERVSDSSAEGLEERSAAAVAAVDDRNDKDCGDDEELGSDEVWVVGLRGKYSSRGLVSSTALEKVADRGWSPCMCRVMFAIILAV